MSFYGWKSKWDEVNKINKNLNYLKNLGLKKIQLKSFLNF
jgi:hypothetical protein